MYIIKRIEIECLCVFGKTAFEFGSLRQAFMPTVLFCVSTAILILKIYCVY